VGLNPSEACAALSAWQAAARAARRRPTLGAWDVCGRAFAAALAAVESSGGPVEHGGWYWTAGGPLGLQAHPVPAEKWAGYLSKLPW
jgi:hypothetical protein